MVMQRIETGGAPAGDAGAPLPRATEPVAGAVLDLILRPNRSLGLRGFVWVIGLAWAGFMIPLVALLGTVALWAMLPFVLGTVALLWVLIRRHQADGALFERLTLSPESIRITHHAPRKPVQDWQANPYWTRVTLHRKGGPVENYITLRGGGREVELGAFLSPEERGALHGELTTALAQLGPRG